VADVVVLVVDCPALVLAGLTNWAWRPGAVLALVDGGALGFVEVVSNILFTRAVWNSLFISELIDTTWVTTITGASSSAIYAGLSIKANRCGARIVEHDIESISKGRG
jgi:hypothetical protein